MAERTLDLRGRPKGEAYREVTAAFDSVVQGISDPLVWRVTLNALLHHGFGHLWTGFYRVVKKGELLRVGPYQGTLGCLEIPFGRGVCGLSAQQERTLIVPDVNAFPGHITCDSRSRSEIVVPVFGEGGELWGVLDIDSDQPGAFDSADQRGLEALVARFATADTA